ncbi:MAG: DNA topoisomerase I [Deltaproteobacteria bacterium RBG_16_48_10]|nr:MAG: DNA topoisomerase I [Deltaproteobacteria bacterium RBG_16_48_10]
MLKGLIIVESPAKVRTIQKFVGEDYLVKASLGHIKDLPEGELGVDLDKDFQPEYVSIPGKGKVLRELKKASREVKNIYLGPDPDREGEAIAWHIAEEIGDEDKTIYRVLFNEITQKAVLDALRHPQKLQQAKYEAQQARRILDRLVGYQISPILWEKVRRGLSAGRVQSVAVRIVCEREREIGDFVPEEYWSLTATLKGKDSPVPFDAKLTKWKGKKVKMANEQEALSIQKTLEGATYTVSKITQQEKQRHPFPPFITSRLQQEAYRKLSFPAQKTMRIAQRLYEGMEMGEVGTVGLITYMRTDSPRVAHEAVHQVREWIKDRFGEPYLPPKPNVYKSRRGAQEAHEAIRPTSMGLTPERVRDYLDKDHRALYKLIWDRFVASQMASAVFQQTTIEIKADEAIFTSVGTVPVFQGFMALYMEGVDDPENGDQDKTLPVLSEGELLALLGLTPKQHFTQPPYRFSEATLIKELEEKGIGRPSTYATILSTIKEKEYVKLEKGKFFPTELGCLVNDLLVVNFPDIFDIEFTAQMEENLDEIEEGDKGWVDTLKEFYQPFEKDLAMAKVSMRDVKKELIPTDILCERCGSKMVKRWGKRGYFLACSSYPKCRYTREVEENGGNQVDNGAPCEKCGGPMVVKNGKFGRFLACSNYPTCKSTRPIETGVRCPQEGCDGVMVERRTRKGKVFYSCSNYPRCTFALWDKPIPEKCPQCDHPYLIEKQGKGGTVIRCPRKECGYRTLE